MSSRASRASAVRIVAMKLRSASPKKTNARVRFFVRASFTPSSKNAIPTRTQIHGTGLSMDNHSSALDDYRPNTETGDMSSPYAQKILFFLCRKCGDYHEKTHPHYKAQKQ